MHSPLVRKIAVYFLSKTTKMNHGKPGYFLWHWWQFAWRKVQQWKYFLKFHGTISKRTGTNLSDLFEYIASSEIREYHQNFNFKYFFKNLDESNLSSELGIHVERVLKDLAKMFCIGFFWWITFMCTNWDWSWHIQIFKQTRMARFKIENDNRSELIGHVLAGVERGHSHVMVHAKF